MEPEDKRMLKRILDLTEDNHKMLKKLHHALWWQRFSSFLYWVVVIGASIGLYYYLQPLFESVSKIYESVTGQDVSINGLFDSFLQKR